jgi:hypothetical protein
LAWQYRDNRNLLQKFFTLSLQVYIIYIIGRCLLSPDTSLIVRYWKIF